MMPLLVCGADAGGEGWRAVQAGGGGGVPPHAGSFLTGGHGWKVLEKKTIPPTSCRRHEPPFIKKTN